MSARCLRLRSTRPPARSLRCQRRSSLQSSLNCKQSELAVHRPPAPMCSSAVLPLLLASVLSFRSLASIPCFNLLPKSLTHTILISSFLCDPTPTGSGGRPPRTERSTLPCTSVTTTAMRCTAEARFPSRHRYHRHRRECSHFLKSINRRCISSNSTATTRARRQRRQSATTKGFLWLSLHPQRRNHTHISLPGRA